MKKKNIITIAAVLLVAAGLYFYIAPGSNIHKRAKYQYSDWTAGVPVSLETFDCSVVWVKMVIYSDSIVTRWKLNSDGDTVWLKPTPTTDTFYLVRAADVEYPVKDSSGKQEIDSRSKLPVFYLSWRNAQVIPKDYVDLRKPIPANNLPRMFAFIESHKADTGRPITHAKDSTQRITIRPGITAKQP